MLKDRDRPGADSFAEVIMKFVRRSPASVKNLTVVSDEAQSNRLKPGLRTELPTRIFAGVSEEV